MRSVTILLVLLASASPTLAAPERTLDVSRCAAAPPALPGVKTWFVRPDGGDAERCDGATDSPVSSAAEGKRCAFGHPAAAVARMHGGDRLVIAAGDYAIAEPLPPIPAGKAGAPTRVVGVIRPGGVLPALRGSGHIPAVLDLTGGSFVEVSCLEITDAAQCVDGHTGRIPCAADSASASIGVRIVDARHVVLRSLDIHGLASTGVQAGRVADVELEDVNVIGNGSAGWNGDVGRDSRDAGVLTFRRVTFAWNGCGEDGRRQPIGCWSQSAGGYGDGLGAALTGGRWRFEDCRFLHNTSDGLDLLWHDGDGDIVIDRVWSEGNAGNQIKTRGEVLVSNTVAIGTCGFFTGKAFTFFVDACRAYGTTLALEPLAGRPQRIVSSTITTEGDSIVGASIPPLAGDDRLRTGQPRDICARLLPITAVNSIFIGGTSFVSHKATALYYRDCGGIEGAGARFDNQYGIVWMVKDYGLPPEGACGPATHNLCTDPRLDTRMVPSRESPALDSGRPGPDVPAIDVRGVTRPRGNGIDRGALERE